MSYFKIFMGIIAYIFDSFWDMNFLVLIINTVPVVLMLILILSTLVALNDMEYT